LAAVLAYIKAKQTQGKKSVDTMRKFLKQSLKCLTFYYTSSHK